MGEAGDCRTRVYIALGENQKAISALEDLLRREPLEPIAREWLRRLNQRPQGGHRFEERD